MGKEEANRMEAEDSQGQEPHISSSLEKVEESREPSGEEEAAELTNFNQSHFH